MLVIVGAGGHAKVVIATARSAGHVRISLVDDDRARWGQHLLGVPIGRGVEDTLRDPTASAVFAIGANAIRLRLAEGATCTFATLVHASAVVESTAILEPGCVVFAGAVIQPDTRIGAHSIINTGASIDHDCRLGRGVHVAPGARLAGGVAVEDGALIGIGASIIPGIRIGQASIVGAGATVVRDVEAGTTVVGVPARAKSV